MQEIRRNGHPQFGMLCMCLNWVDLTNLGGSIAVVPFVPVERNVCCNADEIRDLEINFLFRLPHATANAAVRHKLLAISHKRFGSKFEVVRF